MKKLLIGTVALAILFAFSFGAIAKDLNHEDLIASYPYMSGKLSKEGMYLYKAFRTTEYTKYMYVIGYEPGVSLTLLQVDMDFMEYVIITWDYKKKTGITMFGIVSFFGFMPMAISKIDYTTFKGLLSGWYSDVVEADHQTYGLVNPWESPY